MKPLLLVLLFSFPAWAAAADAPLKPEKAGEPSRADILRAYEVAIADLNRDAQANFHAACINVARDARRKDILIYSFIDTVSFGFKTNGFDVRVLSNGALIERHAKWSGAYPNHHNLLVLNFASVQCASGDKQLGIALVRALARAHPDMEWSSPERNLPIADILKGLEAGGDKLKWFLDAQAKGWEWRSKLWEP